MIDLFKYGVDWFAVGGCAILIGLGLVLLLTL